MKHWATKTNGTGSFGVTLSNWDNQFMLLGENNRDILDSTTPQINVLAGGQIDGPTLGIRDQGGDSYFLQRFALGTHGACDQTASMKFSLQHQNPFVTGLIEGTGTQTRPYPASNFSFLTISNPNVLLWALKPAEDGINRGIVARVWNQGNAGIYTIALSQPITTAERLTHVETSIASATVTSGQLNANINPQQLQTHLLQPASQNRKR